MIIAVKKRLGRGHTLLDCHTVFENEKVYPVLYEANEVEVPEEELPSLIAPEEFGGVVTDLTEAEQEFRKRMNFADIEQKWKCRNIGE